jgi:hypothetical protein
MQIDPAIAATILGFFLAGIVALWKHIDRRFDRLERDNNSVDQKLEDFKTTAYQHFATKVEHKGTRVSLARLFERLDNMNALLHEVLGELRNNIKNSIKHHD